MEANWIHWGDWLNSDMKRCNPDRFWDQFEPEPNSGCWLWTGKTINSGYGIFPFGQRQYLAHRWSYHAAGGQIPDGYDIDHLCRVKTCVNPAHLEPVTRRENLVRGVGVIAQQVKRMACPQGHPYDMVAGHSRRCRTCHQAADRRYHARKKEAMA